MAAINHFSAQTTTNQTTTSTSYVDVTNASLAAANFTAGKKYLLLAYAQIGPNAIDESWVRVVRGTTPTAIDDSEQIFGYSANERSPYWWWKIYTASDPTELIKLQFRTEVATTTTAINFAFLFAMNLSDDVTENTDWVSAETDEGAGFQLQSTYTAFATITFTPGTAGQDWLGLVLGHTNNNAGNTSSKVRINHDSGTTLLPETFIESSTRTGCQQVHTLGRVYNLTAAAHTFTMEAAETGADHALLHSRVLALNLSKFKNYVSERTAGPTSYSATNYATLLESAAITPDVTGDVWIGGSWINDRQNATRETEFRLQKNDADAPAGQTTANYQFDHGTDATDEQPMSLHTLEALTAATLYTFDLDASADATTGVPEAQEISLWVVTMELAAAAPAGSVVPVAMQSYRQRRI